MKISVLEASSDGMAYENFSRVLENTERFDVKEQEFPEDPEAVLVTGSRYAVYEDRDWIRPLLEKIREFSHEVPVMAVCFGHQAVAKALNGRSLSQKMSTQRPGKSTESSGPLYILHRNLLKQCISQL